MNTDVMHLLREADPVVDQPYYDDAQVRLRIDAIVDASPRPDSSDATVVALWDRPPDASRPRWIVALGAAAGVAALAATGLTIAHGHNMTGAGSGSVLSCRVAGDASTARLTAARGVISDRVTAAGGRVASFRVDGSTVNVVARGVDPRTLATVCAPTTAAIRPLIASPVPWNATGPHSVTLLNGLGFDLPRSAAQLAALSPTQRTRLRSALARYDCSATGSVKSAASAVACGPATGRLLVYLLGPAVVIGSGISSATAHVPMPTGDAQWSIQLTFYPGGQAAIADYTGQHNTSRSPGTATSCSANTAPCGDFLASVINNRVETVARIVAPVMGDMETTGGLDRSSATTLADDYTAASIGLTPATR